MAQSPPDLLTGLLKTVSRSFYLTLRILPGAIRPQISLAYLLARASDTIADTDAIPAKDRLEVLEQFRESVLSGRPRIASIHQLAGHQVSPGERFLLERIGEALSALTRLVQRDQEQVKQVLNTIISGQSLDIQRFAHARPGLVLALESDEQLDDYTYRVAGCVGEFWTRLCREHLFPTAQLDDKLLLLNAVRFGKGLQLVNVLRDLRADALLGRCYLPADSLRSIGLEPGDFLNPENGPRLRSLYDGYLDRAQDHLEAGWAYTTSLPRRHVRVRLACAWPILIGIQTVEKLRQGPVLAETRVKVSRREVRRVLIRSVLCYPSSSRWDGLLAGCKHRSRKPLPRGATLAK